MKYKILSYIVAVSFILGILIIMGACGSADLGTIGNKEFIYRFILGLALFVVGGLINKYLGEEEERESDTLYHHRP